jgi:anti-sigma regulatory factor (Ser/Thr protein kinase)
MSTSVVETDRRRLGRFRHEALLYDGPDGFLEGTLPFVREGVDAGEAVLVVVDAGKIETLRAALDERAEGVRFADMAVLGRNPARIIPAWRRFADEQAAAGRPMRGIGEPIWAARNPAELVECQQHESLLNLAFAQGPPLWLLCPYDTEALPDEVVDEARRSHPFLVRDETHHDSDRYRGVPGPASVFDAPLPEPPAAARTARFDGASLAATRAFVADRARAAGFAPFGVESMVVAVNEVATNSLRHGGEGGVVRIWQDGDVLVCEVVGGGSLLHPLVGREEPGSDQESGRGLWLVNQLCDLVQIRSSGGRTAVRLHLRRRADRTA